MDQSDLNKRTHHLDVTLWVGKSGVEAVADELQNQLEHTELVKVKFLRPVRSDGSTETLAIELAELVGAEVFETRGHTAVIHK